MAAELGLLSLNQLQKLAARSQQNNQNHHQLQHQHRAPNPTPPSSWMWNNPNSKAQQPQEDDDSWEVRAFAEDTGNVMGTTWPPRSYTCTFCRREFRSAQALGGHMNVHRRDRARLHQTQPTGAVAINPASSSPTTTSSSTLLIPTQEFATNGGLCLLYQLPNPNGVFTSPSMNACSIESPSTLLSISPYPSSNLMAAPSINFPVTPPPGLNINNSPSLCYSSKAEPSTTTTSVDNYNNNSNNRETSIEELDLELRLGHRPS